MAKILRNQIKEPGAINTPQPPLAGRPLRTDNLIAGHSSVTVGVLEDLQKAVNAVANNGGGRVLLQNGTHTLTNDILGTGAVEFVGENKATTILQLDNGANLGFAGSDVYSTGTITSITSGFQVTGSGTSWLANVTTDHQFFIQNRW